MAKQGKSTAGKHYDVFISYRRSSSESAQLIATHLRAAGYRVFIDVENLRSGKFNEQLYGVIDQCKDFLVILPENALDRCKDPEDWVRKEVIHAMKKGKNIIPVMLSGFSWPDPMPDWMESLREYQAITASSHEYFDLAMDRMRDYLASRSFARRRKTLLGLGIVLLSLAFLALIAIPVIRKFSLPFYTKVSDDLTMQTSVVNLLEDSSNQLGEIWADFYSAYQVAGPKERKHLLDNLSMDLDHIGKGVDNLKVQVAPYQIAPFAPTEDLKLGLRGISSDDVLAAFPLCLSYFEDVENSIHMIREAVSDGVVVLEEDKTIRDNVEFFKHGANVFFYGYLDILSKMPDKALANYRKLVTEWRNFPNGVGLSHSSEEYQQYMDTELNIIRDLGLDLSDRLLHQQQELLDTQADLKDQLAQYEALYEQVKASARVDSTKTPMEIFTNIVILSSFMKEALDIEADVESIDHPITPSRVLQDLEKALKEFSAAYPALEPVSRGAARYYRGVSEGKYPYGGLVTIGSMTPKLAVGDVVTSINGKKTIPANYNSIGEAIQSSAIRSVDYLRLEEGSFHADKADLSKEENSLAFWPMGAGE